MTSKISFKTLIKKTRRSLKISNIALEQIYKCMDEVIEFLKSSPIIENQSTICSSFLSTFMYLLKNLIRENKIIEDEDDEKYSDKLSTLLSFYIDSEAKRMMQNFKDPTKMNVERIFIDKVVTKSRVYDERREILAVKSLAKYFARSNSSLYDDVELGSRVTFNKLLKKIFDLRVPMTINSSMMPYYHQILVVWRKIVDDEKMKENIEKFALDYNFNIGLPENGRLESVRQKVLQLEFQSDSCGDLNDEKYDLFEHIKSEGYNLESPEWLTKLDKVPFCEDATVDLTVDSDDSDIEVELPRPVELIELNDDDDEQERSHNRSIPALMFPRSNNGTNFPNSNRICIQERKSYINSVVSLNDEEKPLTFLALRRKSVMLLEEEKQKLARRRKSCAVDSKRLKKPRRVSRAKSVDVKSILKTAIRSQPKKLYYDMTQPCYVYLQKISHEEIEKFKRKKLKISYFIKKFEKVKKKSVTKGKSNRSVLSKAKPKKIVRRAPQKKNIQQSMPKSQVAKKSCKPNKSSYPDHTKPNLSLLQVLGKELLEASTSNVTNKKLKRSSRIAKLSDCNESAKSLSLDFTPPEKNEEDKCIRIVNVDQDGMEWTISDHQYAHSPWTPNVEGNSLDIINMPETRLAENFEAISDSEQNNDLLEQTINADLLEELLGSRATSYIPDVNASMNNSRLSNLSRSSQSAVESPSKETSVKTPKKRKYSKKAEPNSIESNERPKRERRKRIVK